MLGRLGLPAAVWVSPMRGGVLSPPHRSRCHSQLHGLIARQAMRGVGAQQTSARAQPHATPRGGRSYSPWMLLSAAEHSRPHSSSGIRYCRFHSSGLGSGLPHMALASAEKCLTP